MKGYALAKPGRAATVRCEKGDGADERDAGTTILWKPDKDCTYAAEVLIMDVVAAYGAFTKHGSKPAPCTVVYGLVLQHVSGSTFFRRVGLATRSTKYANRSFKIQVPHEREHFTISSTFIPSQSPSSWLYSTSKRILRAAAENHPNAKDRLLSITEGTVRVFVRMGNSDKSDVYLRQTLTII